MKTIIETIIAALALGLSASAQTYDGNGSTSFGGAIGNGTLSLSYDQNANTVNGSLVTGSTLDNAFVLFIQGVGPGSVTSTSGLLDSGDQLRSAISQYTATGNGGGPGQSTLNFSAGFAPNYAIALQPDNGVNFGGLWSLNGTGANNLPFVSSVNLSPTGTDAQGTYTFSFNLANIGLTGGPGQSFELFGVEVSDTGYSSAESIGGSISGSLGWGNTQTENSFSTMDVPEPATVALLGLSGLASLLIVRRRK